MNAEEVLEALDDEQRAVAGALHGPVCVLAGAGTGKTRAVTHRIAYGVLAGVMAPTQVLAVTFTARAAGEMRSRLRRLGAGGVQARTFHAAALRQLQYFWPRVIGGEAPRLVDTKAPLVGEAVAHCRLRAERAEIRDLAAEIEWAKVTQAAPDDYAVAVAKAGRQPPRDPAEVGRIYAAYEQVKRERGRIDFEDVLLLMVGVLADSAEAAETVRAQYRHFVVDEYQDVSPLQQRLLDLWLGERDSLCVVGDAGQTIYSFTGATPEYLLSFRQRYPDATLVRLVRDYRSTPQVVWLANRLIARAPRYGEPPETASAVEGTVRGPAVRHGLELVAQRPDGPEPTFTEAADENAEAEGVARRIRALLDAGVRASEIAVLYRVNAQSETYEQALVDAGIPYLLRGGERFFARAEIRQAMLLLRGAARSHEGGDGDGLVHQVRSVLAGTGWVPDAPPAASGAARDRWESLAALVRLAEEFADGQPQARLTDFAGELNERAATAHAPTVEGVTLASLHAAKGLEWDAVFLVGLTDGMVPIAYAETTEQVEEERRLLYVGVTRAREHLALSWALARSPGGRANRAPSRFLDGLRSAGVAGGDRRRAGARAGGGRDRGARNRGPAPCRVCGRPLAEVVDRKLGRCAGCPAELDEALHARLRDWRAERAREASIPAYCVFTDATLTAIAETKPISIAELAAISGVGAAKLNKYGGDVVAMCADGQAVADATE